MCNTGNTRVGYIGYNDRINTSFGLADVSNNALKENLKRTIEKTSFSGYSDMGLGLKSALDIIHKSDDTGNQPIIILLSDGETDLSGIKTARKKGIPIYTIGLTNQFNTDLDVLNDISSKTKGISYTASSPYQLVDIFNGILSEHINFIFTPVKSYKAVHKTQNIDINVNNESLSELNIILFSNNKPQVKDVLTSSKDVDIIHSNFYQLIKIKNPARETVRINVEDARGSNIRVATLGTYSFQDVVTIPETITKYKDTTLKFHFYDIIKSRPVADKKLYHNLSVDFYIKNLETGEETKLAGAADSGGISVTTNFPGKGDYELRVEYLGDSLVGKTKQMPFKVTNSSPQVKMSLEKSIAKEEGQKVYDISKIFQDKDNDKLTYSIVSQEGVKADSELKGNKLYITPKQYGDLKIKVKAADTDGGECDSTITIHSLPIWKYYHNVTVIIIIVFIGIITAVISYLIVRYFRKRAVMPKPHFTGCLVGYFLNLKDEEEIPPLKWTLTSYPDKGISLSRLLKDRSLDNELPGSNKIWFSPKVGSSIELIHNTRCNILVGSQIVARNTPVMIKMGEKIYIAFEDAVSEIEIHYKNI